MKKTALQKIKKGATVFLVCTLILSLLSGSFGVVMAMSVKPAAPDSDAPAGNGGSGNGGNGGNGGQSNVYVDPVDSYKTETNEIGVREDVRLLTEAESQQIGAAVVDAYIKNSIWDGDYLEVVLEGSPQEFPAAIRSDGIVLIHGAANDPWGVGERFIKIVSCVGSQNRTYLRMQEPDVNEVFTSLSMALTDSLTMDNLVDATFISGVSAHYVGDNGRTIPVAGNGGQGNMDTEWLSAQSDTHAESLGIRKTEQPTVQQTNVTVGDTQIKEDDTGVGFKFENGDLVVTLNVKFDDEEEGNKKKDDDDDSFVETDVAFGIKGEFALRNLKSHVICEMPELGQFDQLYFGVSGDQIMKLDMYGQFEGKAEPKATEKDLWLFKLEGLNDKRFPLAVFQFQGTSPVYITNKQFEGEKESILPHLYVVLYADWEGSISLELTAGFDYSRGFNNGLRVVKDGMPCLSFENHPYPTAYAGDKESFIWHVNLELTAHTDLTLFGASVLFYVAGINIGEIGVVRLGVEAEGKVNITIASTDKQQDPVEGSLYLRGYLKLLEVKAKLVIKDTLWGSDDWDVGFSFTLLEFELFRLGTQPAKYKPITPISTMPLPDAFESVITLVCDVSGSMNSKISTGESKLQAAKTAAKTIVNSTAGWADTLEGNYGLGLVMFSDYATQVTVPHIDYPYLNECIDTIGDGGGTSIYSGVDLGIDQLELVQAKNKVIILMTDGQDSYDTKAKASAQTAADKGITIFTIGFGRDVDESLLQTLAETTGGEYHFADTENVLGILKSFMTAQQEANGEVILESEGTVSQGETTEAETFEVTAQEGDLMVYTAWPGSFLDTILVDPNGREVDEEYPNVIINKDSIPTSIIVKNPIPGKWTTKIVGVETSYDDEPYFTIVSFMETETKPLNEPMDDKQTAAAYCMAIGFTVALFSLLLLICLGKKAKEQE